jgi:hypothetical protein
MALQRKKESLWRVFPLDFEGLIQGALKLEMGLTVLGLHSLQNLGLLPNLLGLRVPDGALAGLDGVLIGLRTRDLLEQLLKARCRISTVAMLIEDLHWIDSVSEEVLAKIVTSGTGLRLLLLHTRRSCVVIPAGSRPSCQSSYAPAVRHCEFRFSPYGSGGRDRLRWNRIDNWLLVKPVAMASGTSRPLEEPAPLVTPASPATPRLSRKHIA